MVVSRGRFQQSILLQEAGILPWIPRDGTELPGFPIMEMMEDRRQAEVTSTLVA